jgi:hypothetical protein
MKRWVLLPALGAALYGLARGLLKRQVKGVVDDAKTRASGLPHAPPVGRRSPTGRRAAKISDRSASRRDATQPRAAEPHDPALEEQLALRAKLGTVLDVIAGVHANADDAELDLRGVAARTQLRVRPTELRALVDRAAAVLDRDSAR